MTYSGECVANTKGDQCSLPEGYANGWRSLAHKFSNEAVKATGWSLLVPLDDDEINSKLKFSCANESRAKRRRAAMVAFDVDWENMFGCNFM